MKESKPLPLEYVRQGDLCALYVEGVKVFETEKVAILFDQRYHIVLGNGLPEVVRAEYAQQHAELVKNNHFQSADDLVVIEGRFSVKDLNMAITTPEFIGELYSRLQAIPVGFEIERVELALVKARAEQYPDYNAIMDMQTKLLRLDVQLMSVRNVGRLLEARRVLAETKNASATLNRK